MTAVNVTLRVPAPFDSVAINGGVIGGNGVSYPVTSDGGFPVVTVPSTVAGPLLAAGYFLAGTDGGES